jgi:hypothetical protein
MAHAPMDSSTPGSSASAEADGVKDALQFRAHGLVLQARGNLDDLRAALEADELVRALGLRQDLLIGLDALAVLTGAQFPLESPGVRRTDLEALQAFRRAAGRDLERLDAARTALCRSSWRSPADETREAAARVLAARVLAGVLLLSALLAAWWGWQRYGLAASRAAVDAARTATAREGVKLISLGAWLAAKNTGKPLAELAADMTGECAAFDLRKAPPSHPCSQAWARNRMAFFRGSIPAPGAPMDPPAEIFFDPWDAPYVLVLPKDGPARIVSAGPDGLLGTPDDVAALIPYWGEPGR